MSSIPQPGAWNWENEDIMQNQYYLHRACRDGDVQTVTAILKSNSEDGHRQIKVEDCFYGWTPMHWAAYFGKLACLRLLVTEGNAAIDVKTSKLNQTPCHLASFACYPHCLHYLLEAGTNLNEQDYLGETALHKAARTGSVECVSLLLSQSAQLMIRNNTGMTAAELAKLCGYAECCQYIKQMAELQLQSSQGTHPPDHVTPPPLPGCSHTQPQGHGSMGAFLPKHDGNGDAPLRMDVTDETTDGQGTADSDGDILLVKGVGSNTVSVAGVKRSREDEQSICWKKIKLGDSADINGSGDQTSTSNDLMYTNTSTMGISRNNANDSTMKIINNKAFTNGLTMDTSSNNTNSLMMDTSSNIGFANALTMKMNSNSTNGLMMDESSNIANDITIDTRSNIANDITIDTSSSIANKNGLAMETSLVDQRNLVEAEARYHRAIICSVGDNYHMI